MSRLSMGVDRVNCRSAGGLRPLRLEVGQAERGGNPAGHDRTLQHGAHLLLEAMGRRPKESGSRIAGGIILGRADSGDHAGVRRL